MDTLTTTVKSSQALQLTPSIQAQVPAKSGLERWRTPVVAVLLTAYFAWFSRTTLRVHFAPDDMMNIHYYWRLPLWQQLFGPLILWRPLYRPLAAWVLVPVLNGFGLNPVPFRLVMLAVLLANAFLIYRLSLLLKCGARAALLTAIVACYHVGLNNLYYDVAFIYDALCGLFFVAALLYCLPIRERGSIPGWKQMAVFLGLFLAALDSKEMAVTLPVVLLLYEWFYHRPGPMRRWRDLAAWLRGPGRCVLAGGGLTLVFLCGRIFAKDGLIHDTGYVPKLSLARAWAFQQRCFSDLFEKWEYFGRAGIVVLWIAIFYLAWRRPRPVLRFSCLFLLVAPLPIEFLIGRAGACLYIPMIAWAIFFSVVFVDVADGIAGFLAGEPVFRRLDRTWISAALVAAGAIFWAYHNADFKRRFVDPATVDFAPQTWNTIQQLKALQLRVRPRSTMVFLNDPMGSWDMLFIAELQFRDPTLTVQLNQKTPLSPEEIAKADYVVDYRDGRFLQVR